MVLPGKGMGWGEFFKAVQAEWARDRVSDVAGALTFFSILAVFPFLVFLIALGSVFIDPAQAEELVRQLAQFAPPAVTEILSERIRALAAQDNTSLLTISAIGAIWAASGGVIALMKSLNTVYGVTERRPWWRVRLIALAVTLGGAAVALLSAAAAVVAPAIAAAIGGPIETFAGWMRLPVAGVLMMFLWACLYYFLPDVKQEFRFITPGSVIGVLLWLVASVGFSQYVLHFGKYDATYGTLGGVIVLLLWMWISAQVILLGAEINAVLEHRSPEGKAPGKRDAAEPGPLATKTEVEEAKGSSGFPGSPGFVPGRMSSS